MSASSILSAAGVGANTGRLGALRDIGRADRRFRQRTEIKLALARVQLFTSHRERQRELGVGVGRTDVLELDNLAVGLHHDLHRDRTRPGPARRVNRDFTARGYPEPGSW